MRLKLLCLLYLRYILENTLFHNEIISCIRFCFLKYSFIRIFLLFIKSNIRHRYILLVLELTTLPSLWQVAVIVSRSSWKSSFVPNSFIMVSITGKKCSWSYERPHNCHFAKYKLVIKLLNESYCLKTASALNGQWIFSTSTIQRSIITKF